MNDKISSRFDPGFNQHKNKMNDKKSKNINRWNKILTIEEALEKKKNLHMQSNGGKMAIFMRKINRVTQWLKKIECGKKRSVRPRIK